MIKNNRYAQPMTTLGTLVKGHSPSIAPLPFDSARVMLEITAAVGRANMTASIAGPGTSPTAPVDLGDPAAVLASVTAWTNQDDDAHEPCSLTACRHPLHPGPCKGWKGTLHSVSPGTYKQVEAARVEKANARRVKIIADLRAQGKPIPKRLLAEIKPKPAPTTHAAHNASTVPLGQVNQKADLAGGQAHAAGQAVSKAAGVQVKTAPPLPLGPKKKKPTVAGRGPAFVITQPKVTDTYKLDKADKITPQEWNALSDADKTTIRNELTAIKARGFGPQQTKADALLARFPAAGVANGLAPGTPGTKTSSSGKVYQKVPAAPGKVSLGQAAKAAPATPKQAPTTTGRGAAAATPLADDAAAKAANGVASTDDVLKAVDKVGPGALNPVQRDAISKRLSFIATHPKASDAQKKAARAQMTRLGMTSGTSAPPSKTPTLPAPAPAPKRGTRDQSGILNKPLPGGSVTSTSVGLPNGYRITRDGMGYSLKHNGKLIRTSATQEALEKYAHEHAKTQKTGAPGTPATPPQAAPAPSPASTGPTPQAPGPPNNTPKAFAPHVQHARAVAGRAVGRPTGKAHVDTYGKLTKAEFDSLDTATQRTIRDDLTNAKGKFLDPKKQQAAQDLLDRFGSRHTAPAPGAPAAPAHPKGYSDPQQEAVKATSAGLVSTDDVLKTVGRLSPDSIKGLDDDDRKRLLGRLAFVATHPKATPDQKAKATAFGRIINSGSPAQQGKWDHTPSLSELHAEEKKGGAAQDALKVADALKAADSSSVVALPGSTREDRLKALAALPKAQFDALTPDEQRKITDALDRLHTDQKNNGVSVLDPDAEKALVTYTGLHPAIHRMRQAEADFRAGKIDGEKFYNAFVHARVQAPTKYGDPTSPGAVLAKEAQRIAEDNPKLPLWTRSSLLDNPYGNSAYDSIVRANSRYDWEPAPRLSSTDIKAIFRATEADLAKSHPIHAEAVKALREHVITTGLKGDPGVPSGSPWSAATRSAVADALLGISYSDPEVSPARLKGFQDLTPNAQRLVRKVLEDRLRQQTNDHAKTGTYITLRDLDGQGRHTPDVHAALLAASDSFASPGDLDTYRKLDPADYSSLPNYAQQAIRGHLDKSQDRAQRNGPALTWSPQDNALKVMPAALADHLAGTRNVYSDRRERNASDIANYGAKIINPFDRTRAYREVPIARFRTMTAPDQAKIIADLDSIAKDGALSLTVRYNAQFTKDVGLGGGGPAGTVPLNLTQLVAVGAVDPTFGNQQPDITVLDALTDLDKADFDSLAPVYRETIDDRIRQLPGVHQQAFTAKFHPAAPATATPAGLTPTSAQTNVPPHVQAAIDTIYGVHSSGKSHTMAHQLSTYGALRGGDFNNLNAQEQTHLLGDLSFIATTAKGPSADKAKKLIDRFTPAGTPAGQVGTPAIIPPANSVPGQVRYATPLKGLAKAKDSGKSGDGWLTLPGGQRVWGSHGAAGLLLQHVDPQTGEKRYLMVQRGPAISDPGKWTFPGGASDSKETPHQGATRETIEELGLKDDVFKDALVHGDHTFTVPGSTWKYTTVAAQVPNMIKPDLSTAHARAETSDAKWMTAAEIKALDAAGKLHGPIAGGKLEQNVISLFPTGGGPNTLGQIVRPGPVSKRQGRLAMPSGGRQNPANYNAWPHAHKPSKGKDLIPDKATLDAQRQKIKQDRKLYDGKTADGRLAAIGAQQGFDDTPTVVGKAEIDRLLATGDYIEVWRGVSGAGGANWRSSNSGGKTAADINEEMRSGPAYYGKGIFGNGYYLATQRRVATQYADGTKGSIARMLIPKSAVTQTYDKVKAEAFKNPRTSKAKNAGYGETATFYDPGRYAAAKGLDGIEINPHHMSPSGGAGHVASAGKPAFNWLNRSVLIMQKEPG
jgi:8-oxo-dGTP pyrophosphatase MutT (NUDIX family)